MKSQGPRQDCIGIEFAQRIATSRQSGWRVLPLEVVRPEVCLLASFTLLVLGYLGFIEPQVKQASVLAARAAELDNSDPWMHVALGYVAFTKRRTEESVARFQRAGRRRNPT